MAVWAVFLISIWFVQGVTTLVLPAGLEASPRKVVIPEGATFQLAIRILAREDLIGNPRVFLLAGRMTGADRRIKPGEYELHGRMSPFQILDLLKEGVVRYEVVVIPEGYTLRQISRQLEAQQVAEAEEFLALTHDPGWIRSLGIGQSSLEGYLFPDTYFVSPQTVPERIITRMVKAMEQHFTPEWDARARALGLTRHQVLTLASLIEKETSSDSERPMVSAVFHNRLQDGMLLQSDPTIIYALNDFDGNLKRKHLRIPSPYNTYLWVGLPPGPIANPGRASLIAALYPAPVEHLYFVSKNDGTHYFSDTIEEHSRAVSWYQKHRRRGDLESGK